MRWRQDSEQECGANGEERLERKEGKWEKGGGGASKSDGKAEMVPEFVCAEVQDATGLPYILRPVSLSRTHA
jgi:hypothetical protein